MGEYQWSVHDILVVVITTYLLERQCLSNLSIDRTESITLVIILDLIHLAAWSDLPSFRKHIYYLPTGGNIVGVLEFNILEDAE